MSKLHDRGDEYTPDTAKFRILQDIHPVQVCKPRL